MLRTRTIYTLKRTSIGLFAWLMCFAYGGLMAQTSPGEGREGSDFRLNELRPFVVAQHAQQPPYLWSATYLRNAFGQPGSNNFVLDSSVCSDGTVGTSQFEARFKISNTYDSDLRLTEQLFREKQAGGNYDNFSRKLYTYDAAGRQTAYLYQLWDAMSNAWVDDYEESTQYNSDGQVSEYKQREIDGNGQWLNLSRETRSYDSTLLSEILTEYWNVSWIPANRKLITYNEFGFYTEILELASEVGTWDTVGREVATYSNFGFDWDTYRLENYVGGGNFEGVVRESYSYDQDGLLEELTRQNYDPILAVWENEFKEQFQYTNKGIWTGWAKETWQNGAWVFSGRQMFQNGPQARQDIMETYDSGSMSWNQAFRAVAAYDSDQNLVQEVNKQSWDMSSSDWVNQNETRQCEHFWSERSTTAIADDLPMMSCQITNPYRAYAPMQCEGMENGKQYDLQLIDLQGRTVYQKVISGGNSFQIDRSLSTGLYQVQITEGTQVRYTQKLIIQP
ncbi:MAG: T9SS type A sorting domain-containing protein [Bacteroidota bacterium]